MCGVRGFGQLPNELPPPPWRTQRTGRTDADNRRGSPVQFLLIMSRSTNSSDAFPSSFMSVDPDADSSRQSTNWFIGGKNRVSFVLSLVPLWKTVFHLCSA